MGVREGSFSERLARLPALRALRYRDFRILWLGAFVSFIGSQVQTLAQGYLVYELTGNTAKLAMVSFAMTLPISFLGPFAGAVTDLYDRRQVLFISMAASAVGPILLGVAVWLGRAEYWHFIAVAVVLGLVQCVELPARQAIVRAVVDEEDLPAAIPAQASTFNLARIVGPALGGLVYQSFGPAVCFFVNGASYFALAFAGLGIRADLSPEPRTAEPVRDLILEGMRFTFREGSLRLLFLMEAATSIFGTFYISLMPAIAKSMFGLDQKGLGVAFSFVGAGAVFGLFLAASLGHRRLKAAIVHLAMTVLAVALLLLSVVQKAAMAFPLFFLTGMCTIMQFNTTNTLFQLLAPSKLRGRVLSMHMWAIAGVAPIGILGFGWAAEVWGLRPAIATAATILLLLAALAWTQWGKIREPELAIKG